MREALKFLGGSVAVYLIVAACSASSGHRDREASNDRGGGGTRTRGGAGGAGSPGGAAPGGEASGGMMGTAGEDTPGDTGGTRDAGGPSDSGVLDGMTDPVPDAMADAGSTNGTRLKARYYAGADGSRQTIPYYTFYDTERRENCAFTAGPDGVFRCMPAATAYGTGNYFSDFQCMQQLAYAVPTCGAAPPRYVTTTTSTSCGSTYTIHEIGAAFTATMLYVKSGTTCTATATPTNLNFYSIGADVPWSSFVQATEEVEQ